MGIGNWLSGIPGHIQDSEAGLISMFSGADPTTAKAVAGAVNASPLGTTLGAAATATNAMQWGVNKVESVPVVGDQVKFLLDLPNRSWDTILNVAMSAQAADATPGGDDSWGVTTNASSWADAWKSWGQKDHVSAGQIVGGTLMSAFGKGDPRFNTLDPLKAKDAQIIQAHAADTWYGSLSAASADIAAGFVMPGAGLVKAGLRASREVNAVSTAAKAEDIAVAEAKAFDEGRVGGLKKTPVRSIAATMLHRPQNPNDLVARLRDTLDVGNARYGGNIDGWNNYLRSMLEDTPDEGVAKLATLMAETNRTVADPALASHVQMNAFLAINGSASARAVLTDTAPLMAKSMQTMMAAPPEPALADALAKAHLAQGQAFDPGTVIRDFYGTAADAAEHKALIEEVGKAADYAKAARELEREIRALKPTKGFDAERLRELRSVAAGQYGSISQELRAARANHKAAQSLARDTYRAHQEATAALKGRLLSQGTDVLDAAQSQRLGAENALGRSQQAAAEQAWTTAESRARLTNPRAKKASATDAYGPRAQMSASADAKAQLTADKASVKDAEMGVAQAQRELAMERASAHFDAHEQAAVKQAEADLEEANRILGESRARVEDTTSRLNAARADRDLFNQTPLSDPTAFEAWRSDIDAATGLRRDAVYSKQWIAAEKRLIGETIRTKRAEANRIRPGLNKINDQLNDIFALADDQYVGAGRLSPSKLDQVKTWYRDTVGDEYLFRTGDANRVVRMLHWPQQALAAIGTNRARGAINVNNIGVGSRELAESMKRSGVFTGDEILAKTNKLIAAPAAQRQFIVAKVEEEMLAGIAKDFGLTLDEAKQYITLAKGAYGKGRAHLAQAVDEQQGAKIVSVLGPDDEGVTAFDGAWLRSHLADTVGFVDPGVARSVLKEFAGDHRKLTEFLHSGVRGHAAFMQLWKHGVLMRPGLGVRAMLDTGIRATAMLGAATQFVQAVNGTQHLLRNRGNSAMVRIGLRDQSQVAFHAMGQGQFDVNIGNGMKKSFAPYSDRAQMAAHAIALQQGGSPSRAFRGSTSRFESSLRANRASWDMKRPDSNHWSLAYTEYAQVLGASPTARALMDLLDEPGTLPRTDLERFTDEMFARPGVEDEYRKMVQAEGVSREDYIKELARQVSLMFPTAEVRDTFLKGQFNRKGGTKLVDRYFPPEERFEVPGPQVGLDGKNIMHTLSGFMEKFYNATLDKPDLWLARHPVFVTKYRDYVQAEAKAAVQRLGDGEYLTADQLRTIDKRARARATQQVRRTFYDNNRFTGAHQVLTKIAPFFMPFEDALMSWSRLMYDDPTRIFTIGGLWNAPDNASQAVPGGLVVDVNGDPVRRGQHVDGETYVRFPVKLPFLDTTEVRWRKQALNSIAQGNVPWLPGFGPEVQAATTVLLGRVLPHDVAIDLLGADNPIAKNIFNSMYLGGVPPEASAGAMGSALLPSWMRNFSNDVLGSNYGQHIGYSLNDQYLEAQKTGKPFDATVAYHKAEKQAWSSAVVRLLSSGLFGMSGTAVVDGQFYVDQMHKYNAMTPAQLKALGVNSGQEAFAKEFPEAANLDWQMSKNETGISATVNAAKATVGLKGIIDKNPKYGWFIVGDANVGGQFSRAVYNQQLADKYGMAKLGRSRESASQQVNDAIVQQGWDEYTKLNAQLDQLHKQAGEDPDFAGYASYVKAEFVKYMADKNPAWVQDKNTMSHERDSFMVIADTIANTKKVRDRPDMVAYRDYRQARDEILKTFGLQSFSGTSVNSAAARAAAYRVGQSLADQSLGFGQAWDRMLSSEVEPQEEDGKKLTGVAQ